MRILIVEDEQYRIDLFNERLGAHDLTVAKNADRALELLRSEHGFDILLLDHDLGDGGNGQDVAREIVKICATRKWPQFASIVVHSFNLAGACSMVEILSRGGCRPQRMPFGPELLNRLESALGTWAQM